LHEAGLGTVSREAKVLRGLSQDFGSEVTLGGVVESSIRWTSAATEGVAEGVRVRARDERERLVSLSAIGDMGPGSAPSSDVRRALDTGRACILLRSGPASSLALIPLVARASVLGLLEVAGPTQVLKRNMQTLEAIASQTAVIGAHEGSIRVESDPSRTTFTLELPEISSIPPEQE
jgi:hypothetical protein